MKISFKHKGKFKKTFDFFHKIERLDIQRILNSYGQQGVAALSAATPVDTGLTSQSWSFETRKTKNSYIISWTNTNIKNGVPIAILIQYDHATGNGAWVLGRDYINPAMLPIVDRIAEEVWMEVTSA